ncbi:unnamed protein product [Absidia cylindrospora]
MSHFQELQRSWETKVARSRVADFGFNSEGYDDEEGEQNRASGNDANRNMAGNNAYSEASSQANHPTATVANLASLANSGAQQQNTLRHDIPPPANIPPSTRPPQPHQMNTLPHPTQQLPSSIPYSLPPPTNLPHLPPVNGNGHFPPMNLQQQQQQQQQQQHQQQQQQPFLPDLHLPGGRHNIPQNDGANDDRMTTAEIDAHLNQRIMETHSLQEDDDEGGSPSLAFSATTLSGATLDMDHLPDHIKLLMKDARKRAVKVGAIRSTTRIGQLDGEEQEEDDNDAINSDLDDTDDDDDDPDGGEEVEHIILCLYDKVTRTKNKWKCVLKDGIMLVNGRDYLFHRGNGDFEW